MLNILRFAGRNGTWVVISGVVLGFCLPGLSAATRPYLDIAIFLFTFGSFLKVDEESFRAQLQKGYTTPLIIAWATLGVPLVVYGLTRAANLGPEISQGLIFWSLVPTSPACVAFAAMLRLSAPLALLATVAATAASPLVLPLLAATMGGYRLTVSPIAISIHLLVLTGGACIASVLVKRFFGGFIKANSDATIGVAVFALILAGMGSMRGMQAYFLAQPLATFELLLLAFSLNLIFQLIGSLLFWRSDRSTALTAGLLSGTRTITMAWVVLGNDILPTADVFLGTAMVAKYICPALTKPLIGWINAGTFIGASRQARS